MGYQDQDKHGRFHEGYVIGLLEEEEGSGLFRELTLRHDGRHDRAAVPLRWVCVGCDCGWRSPRLFAPRGTDWTPCIVWLAHGQDDAIVAGYEEGARKIWREHMDEENRRSESLKLRMDGDEYTRALRESVARRRA
jgi:hypothetical protein